MLFFADTPYINGYDNMPIRIARSLDCGYTVCGFVWHFTHFAHQKHDYLLASIIITLFKFKSDKFI